MEPAAEVEKEVVESPEEAVEVEIKIEQEGADGEPAGKKDKAASQSLKDAWKQVESFGQALSVALQGRGNVVTLRVNDEALRHMDMLIEAEVTKSRSESAAFLINEGIRANQELFDRISSITQKIVELRNQLREEVHEGVTPQ